MEKFVVFSSSGQSFAIPIEVTEKIIHVEELTRIPDTSSYVLGAIDYGEGILPIVDLGERFFQNKTEITADTKVIVINWQEKKIGLAVDKVTNIQSFESADQESPENADQKAASYVVAFIRTEEGIILQLDVDSIFSKDGVQELVSLINR
ncbi:chemotaxis protein CheW [Carnobacterium pleistocenium]|uniref:chemotaxis protein CheW n=1 Tax=Carnobacterium pleistocenium TaxID=181073 RepID=UPI000556D388|nr:chemotaxis protein CheW [Carnobacterium pleistocenium]